MIRLRWMLPLLVVTVGCDPEAASRERIRLEREARDGALRQEADSLLSTVPDDQLRSLSDRTLNLMLNWGDSTVDNRVVWEGVRKERDRRDRERKRRQEDERAQRVHQMAANCQTSVAATRRLIREHHEWGDYTLARVLCRNVWIGMTRDELIASRGRPGGGINRTETPYGVREQWVYGDLYRRDYVYLTGGLVTAIRN